MPGVVPIEAVIFDYGGVISVSPFERLAAAEARLGLSPGTLADLLGYGIDVAEPAPGEPYTNKWHLLEIGAIELTEYTDWVTERSTAVFGRPVDFAGRMDIDVMSIHWMVVQEIGRLRAEGYKLAICSNNIAAYREVWQRQFPIDWFDAVVDSSDVGVRKPDPAIYLLTAERLGVQPVACAFLDDHPANVAGAAAAGMAGILVQDPWAAIADLRAVLTARAPNGHAPGAPRSPAPAPPSS